MRVEALKSVEGEGWLSLRQQLWPDASRDEHLAEMAEFLEGPARFAQFVARGEDDRALGLVEASVRRDYVNGTETPPVAFLEGIFVRQAVRRQDGGPAEPLKG